MVAVIDRLVARIEIDPITGCWIWPGATNGAGYGKIGLGTREQGNSYTHIIAFEHFVGPIPDGLHIDHLCHTNDSACAGGRSCRHRACCNPDHLELVEPAENTRRGLAGAWGRSKTHCPQGHPYDEANTLRSATGTRRCRTCHNANSHIARDDRRAKEAR